MAVGKSRKAKAEEYNRKYSGIPLQYEDRLNYLYDQLKLANNPKKQQMILEKRHAMMNNIQWFDIELVVLYEDPEGASRPKFRIINRKNFHMEAMNNSQFVHVYTPNAADDYHYIKRRMDTGELMQLNGLINTPVEIEYNAYIKTPSYFSDVDIFMSEIGLIRPDAKPDWDNIGKKYCDMYNHNVWLDDNSVIDGSVHKYYSILPRIEIKMRYLNVIYNKNMYNKIVKRKNYDNTPLDYLDSRGGVIHNGEPL